MPESSKPIEKLDITNARKISAPETPSFTRPGFDGRMIVESAAKAGFNALLVDVHGEHPPKRMLGTTTRVYHVLQGSGTFTLNGETHEVKTGDTFIIPPENEYGYQGTMKLFEFNVDPANEFTDKKLAE